MYNENEEKARLMEAIIFFIVGIIGLFAMVVWAAL